MAGLYAPDASLQELLSIKSFQDNFDILEFINAISDKLIAQSKEDTEPFDPASFIRTFESSVDTLLAVRNEVQTKKEAMEKSVRIAEQEFSRKLSELNSGFDSVGKSFGSMESKISQVGRTAIGIGEQLEAIHLSRQRAQAAHDLIHYYNQFSHADTSSLDTLRKDGGKAGRQQVAVILRRLVTVAKEVDVPGADETRDRIDKYCESFERDMLKLFDKSYRKGDPKMMGHCAQTLLDFNGGASCVQIYVNQHDFFISKSKLLEVNTTENSKMWNTLSDPDVSPPKEEPGLIHLFTEIRNTVKQEFEIVQAVFPSPPIVMQVFLQRVFAQSIQQYVELLVYKAQTLSTLSYLRILQLSHANVSKLVEDLKAYDFSSSIATRSSVANEVARGSEALNILTPNAPGGTAVAIGTMLENAMEELFVPYNEGAKYLEKESKSLSELYATYLDRFAKYNEAALKAKSTGLFDRLVQFTGTTTGTSTGASAQAAATAAFMNISGRIRGGASAAASSIQAPPATASTFSSGREQALEQFSEEDGKLNIDVAEKILKWHAEAVGRCVELSAGSDLPKNAFSLMRVLATTLGTSYVETAIDAVQTLVEARDPKMEPDFRPVHMLKQVDMICHLWQQYVNVALLPLANASVTLRREMTVFNNQTISRIEGAANGLLQRVADAIIAWLAMQLSKQKKNDFKPKNDDISFARVNTEPCEACCDTLEKVRDAAKESISGKNLEVFLMEIGVAFHTLLLDHLKKFPVSATGGLMLAKDLKLYQDTISTFALPSLSERFEFIRQLGNVFLVRPEILKSYMMEGYLGRIEPALLRPFLMQRSDWAQFERAFDLMGVTAPNSDVVDLHSEQGSGEINGSGSNVPRGGVSGFRDRFGAAVSVSNRLSSMMRDLENLRISGAGSGTGEQGAHSHRDSMSLSFFASAR